LLPNAGAAEMLPVRDVAMDGAIIYSCCTTESSFGWLRKRRLPLVLVGEPDGGELDAYSSAASPIRSRPTCYAPPPSSGCACPSSSR
jgi:hypothetical protein